MATDRPRGVINLSGRDYPTWPFVLNKAHEMGLLGIETELLQIPCEENGSLAIVRAVATFSPSAEGVPLRRFTGIGDAGPKNVSAKVAGATIRMAETRAMGRALRAAVNIGETMYEEMPDLDAPPVRESRGDRAAGDAPAARGVAVCSVDGCGTVLNPGQVAVSERNHQRRLCPAHQREAQP